MMQFSEDDIVFAVLNNEVVKAKVILVWNNKEDILYSCLTQPSSGHSEAFDGMDDSIFPSKNEAMIHRVLTS